ncbi:hypothetical protein GCM10009680_26640 [Streptomyces yatensis]|uniref:Uncharacterized protein n=1 Tax=Streptomyces yatensis TaxID=155177 RepID=A0ABN2HD04_9ACTN
MAAESSQPAASFVMRSTMAYGAVQCDVRAPGPPCAGAGPLYGRRAPCTGAGGSPTPEVLRRRDDAGLLDGPSARYPEVRFVD